MKSRQWWAYEHVDVSIAHLRIWSMSWVCRTYHSIASLLRRSANIYMELCILLFFFSILFRLKYSFIHSGNAIFIIHWLFFFLFCFDLACRSFWHSIFMAHLFIPPLIRNTWAICSIALTDCLESTGAETDFWFVLKLGSCLLLDFAIKWMPLSVFIRLNQEKTERTHDFCHSSNLPHMLCIFCHFLIDCAPLGVKSCLFCSLQNECSFDWFVHGGVMEGDEGGGQI